MDVKGWATGGIITLLIGGSVFTFSQADVAKNLASDTGMSQEQAEQYVNSVGEEDMAEFDVIGGEFVAEGNEVLALSAEVDCVGYEYEWESPSLTCASGKQFLRKFGQDSVSLGNAYIKLAADDASAADISETIRLIDVLNADMTHEMVISSVSRAELEDSRNTNSYNKALLQTALDSTQ